MAIFDAGTAIRIETSLTNYAGSAINASACTVTVTDRGGTVKVSAASMSAGSSTGDYYYVYQTSASDALGKYTVEIVASVGGIESVKKEKLFVLE
jgi:hypothetical protein